MIIFNNKVLIGGAILLLLGVGVFFAVRSVDQVSSPKPVTEVTSVQTGTLATPPATSSAVTENIVATTASGFSPKEITIKAGDSVTFINSDSAVHTVNSDPHPQHTTFQFINQISRLAAGEKKSLTFSTMGTYKFHDHLNPQLTGTVIVN